MYWSRHQFAHKHLTVIHRLLAGRTRGFEFVDVDLTAAETTAIQALLDERNALEADRNRIQALLDQELQKARFRNREAPWQSYDRLRRIVEAKEALEAPEVREEPKGPPAPSWWRRVWDFLRILDAT